MKAPIIWGTVLFLLGIGSTKGLISDFRISGQVQDGASVRIEFNLPESNEQLALRLYRSTHPISSETVDPIRYPIVVFHPTSQEAQAGFLDRSTSQNVTCHYMAAAVSENSRVIYSNVIAISLPGAELPHLIQPEIWIDKIQYLLEIRDQGRVVKRYPIILGRDPVKRKLHQDFATTPEGLYRVTNRKQRSTFRHAFDIDYPNSTDRIRYDLLKSVGRVPDGKGIGGEIQIHGQMRTWRLERNWTWGCIALRNEDIDELFEHKEIKVGTPVYILGEQITKEDAHLLKKKWDLGDIKTIQDRLQELNFYHGDSDGKLGAQTRKALGRYQLAQGYPVTCGLDSRTTADLLPSHLK